MCHEKRIIKQNYNQLDMNDKQDNGMLVDECCCWFRDEKGFWELDY